MQCSTGANEAEASLGEMRIAHFMREWGEIRKLLPQNWEEQALTQGALLRRRSIHSAEQLLQLILAYALGDLSLRLVGAWGLLQGVADVSDVTILNRLRQSGEWLAHLVAGLLCQPVAHALPAVHLRLVDATSISCPGSQGSDWRVHVSWNVGAMCADSVTLTDVKGGEGFHHFASSADEILVADRAYGYVNSLAQLLGAGGQCVVRVRWKDLATYTAQGQPFDVIAWLRQHVANSTQAVHSIELQVTTAQGAFPLRLVACTLPAAQAERARVRLRRQAKKKQTTPTAESLLVAGFVLLVTNLPAQQWSAPQVGALYRLRWQVELYFKRLKSIMHLDHLRAHDPQLARTYLLAKLLAALLLDRLTNAFLAPLPEWGCDLTHPLSPWRLTRLLWLSLQSLFTQHLLLLLKGTDPASLRRYLCNSPRKRPQQDVLARFFVRSLSVINVLSSLS